jgi:hypothetical protein
MSPVLFRSYATESPSIYSMFNVNMLFQYTHTLHTQSLEVVVFIGIFNHRPEHHEYSLPWNKIESTPSL